MTGCRLVACVGLALCFLALVGALNPDLERNVTQIIQARGYPVEDHRVITPDGFVLSMQRITGRRYSPGSPNIAKPVVLLQHGLEDNSFTWVANEVVEQSLGFILADAGYDVWMNNIRGNTYSNSNINYKPSQSEFWAWSFDEMARIDLPAVLDYILKESNATQLSYIGHSQGTMMGFIGFEDPAIASKVNIFIALAPVAWVHHCSSVLLTTLSVLDFQYIVEILGVKDFSPDTGILKILLPFVCTITPDLCDNVMGLIMGWNTTDVNNTRLPVIMAHEPSGTSMQNIMHWTQLVKKNVFQAYDYGSSAQNMKHYNSTTPPVYNPSRITIPIALLHGGLDALADPTDVAQLIPLLKNVVFSVNVPDYAHIDFVWGADAYRIIYPSVLQLLKKYSVQL